MMTGIGMGFGFLGWFVMLLFWAGLIALAVLLVRALFTGVNRSTDRPERGGSDAREILNQRYARGEIDREEFERIKQDLI